MLEVKWKWVLETVLHHSVSIAVGVQQWRQQLDLIGELQDLAINQERVFNDIFRNERDQIAHLKPSEPWTMFFYYKICHKLAFSIIDHSLGRVYSLIFVPRNMVDNSEPRYKTQTQWRQQVLVACCLHQFTDNIIIRCQ